MSKFQPGDRVRCISIRGPSDYSDCVGLIGVVTVSSFGTTEVSFNPPTKHGKEICFYNSELELADLTLNELSIYVTTSEPACTCERLIHGHNNGCEYAAFKARMKA